MADIPSFLSRTSASFTSGEQTGLRNTGPALLPITDSTRRPFPVSVFPFCPFPVPAIAGSSLSGERFRKTSYTEPAGLSERKLFRITSTVDSRPVFRLYRNG